jgi:hypothetical protein
MVLDSGESTQPKKPQATKLRFCVISLGPNSARILLVTCVGHYNNFSIITTPNCDFPRARE